MQHSCTMEENQKNNILDCVVIGAGPAGLSAAIYLKRANVSFIVLEKETPCSKLMKITQLNNYAGFNGNGVDLAINMLKQVKSLGCEIGIEEVIDINKKEYFILKTNKKEYWSRALILATGFYSNISPIKNVNKYLGKGVSTCVVCDAYFYKNKSVGYITSGENWKEEILYLSKIVKNVYVFKAPDKLSQFDENVIFINDENIIEVQGNETVENLLTDKNKYKIDCLFINEINTQNNLYFEKLNLDRNGIFIKTDKELITNVKGVFVAGDLVDRKLKQISVAVGDGAIAASNVISYLQNEK